jgi:hypothetical protein
VKSDQNRLAKSIEPSARAVQTTPGIVEDAQEQAVVAQIQREYLRGKGLRAIARALELAGIRCRGRRWSHSTIRSILRGASAPIEINSACRTAAREKLLGQDGVPYRFSRSPW